MMKRLLLCALAAAAMACNSQSGSAVKPDNDLYRYIPPDATFVAGARVSHLRTSPLYKTFRERLPAQALPYEKDASEIVAASDGVHTLVLARGKFDKKQLERDVNGGAIESLAADLVAIGDPATVAVAKRRAGSPLAKQIPSSDDLWFITSGHIPFQFPERSNFSNLNRLARDLQLGVLGLRVTDAIQADAHFDFANEQASEQAHTALRGFIGLARLSTPNGKEQLLEVLDRLLVSRDKSRVLIKADWPPELVKTLMGMIPAR